MSLHKSDTPAEKLAAHLESAYGVQLDAFRHQALVTELEAFGVVALGAARPIEVPFIQPTTGGKYKTSPRAKKQQEKPDAQG